MKSTLFTLLLLAGLSITSCDYFESNDDNTYLNRSGKVKIINELGYDASYTIKFTDTESLTGTISNGEISGSLDVIPGFAEIMFIESNAVGNPDTVIVNNRLGFQADKFHYVFAVQGATSRTIAILDNFASFTDTNAKVRILNASATLSGYNTILKVGAITNPSTETALFSNLTYPGFDITPVNVETGDYNLGFFKSPASYITPTNSTVSLSGKSGYTILVKQDDTVQFLNDSW